MNIKREEDSKPLTVPSSSKASRNKRVTFIDLTEEDKDDTGKNPPQPQQVHSSSNVLRDIAPNVDAAFTLDYNPQPSPQRSSASVFNESVSSRVAPSSATKMRTSAITLLDTQHGRKRRMQRAIPRRTIQAAIKHGKKSQHPSGDPNLLVYHYQGQKHIITKDERRLVTTMVLTIKLEQKTIYGTEFDNHERSMNIIHNQKKVVTWNSHSVLIVDRSGSMRNSDVNGARTRLGAVWMAIAEDFIKHRLKAGMASSLDVISIILMGEGAEVIVDRFPTDYVLYNKIVKFFYDSEEADMLYCQKRRVNDAKLIRPRGHGCYGPSLAKAQELLSKYDDCASALQLLLLSDGRPSDGAVLKVANFENALKAPVEQMASSFGRRFTFAAIGMGNMKDYDCLKNMAGSCKDFGGSSTFQVPGMSCAEIGVAITGAATSLADCQTELAAFNTGGPRKRQRRVRSCLRENSRLLPVLTEEVDETFNIYMEKKVDRCVYRTIPDDDNRGKEDAKPKHSFVAANLQHPEARGVAMKQRAFGEGSERLAFQFFEVAADGFSVVGEPKVSKESRFLDDGIEGDDSDEIDNKSRDKFAKRFCSIQNQAKSAAEAFNRKLDSIATLDPQTPRISFIDCCVYYLTDDERGEFSVVVEPKLEGRFEKWNNNNGWRRQSSSDVGGRTLVNLLEDDDDSDDSVIDITGTENREFISVTRNEVAQSFSHFSYHWTRKKIVICDLQGVFDEPKNTFCFTDPVIHYNNARNQDQSGRSGRYGRTDMGQKGIDSFLKSHKCNRLCELVCNGFLDATNE